MNSLMNSLIFAKSLWLSNDELTDLDAIEYTEAHVSAEDLYPNPRAWNHSAAPQGQHQGDPGDPGSDLCGAITSAGCLFIMAANIPCLSEEGLGDQWNEYSQEKPNTKIMIINYLNLYPPTGANMQTCKLQYLSGELSKEP